MSSENVCIPAKALMGNVVDIDFDRMVDVNFMEVAYIAATPAKSSWTRLLRKGALAAAAAQSILNTHTAPVYSVDPVREGCSETILSSGITTYGDKMQRTRLETLIDNYQELWKDQTSFAKTPSGEEMTLPLVEKWDEKYKPGQAKVYPGSGRHQSVGPNNITRCLSDPTQAEIILAIAGSSFISTIDAASFFYQWKVRNDDQHKLTVSSHRGQETFSCAVMGFRNSPAYVQRVIDTILRPDRAYARAYIDNIVIFSGTFEEHESHLQQVFTNLEQHNIHFSPKKCFLSYPSVALLGQRVDALGLSSAEDKLAANAKITFPRTLKQLEYYLGLTSWLRIYFKDYARKAAPLQARKVKLYEELRSQDITKGPKRKRHAIRQQILDVIEDEHAAFEALQTSFRSPAMLHHFDPNRRLYADLDASGKGIGAMIYHSTAEPPTQISTQPILFISRLLKHAETRYWPTELEVAALCWVVAKIRHMIESCKTATIIYTDHNAAIQISTQSSMTTTSLVRMNMRHVRSSEYLSRFRLEVRHKPGKLNVVPDALSRLDTGKDDSEDDKSRTPEMVYLIQIVNISSEFVENLKQAYRKDSKCLKLIEILDNEIENGSNAAVLPFEYRNGILYAKLDNVHNVRRPVVPKELVKTLLEKAHDDLGHVGYTRVHQRVSQNFFVFNLSKELHMFIDHCHECAINATPFHSPYGSLQPILSPPKFFHTLTIDFILALPRSVPDKFDCAMSVTNKFSKAITIIAGKGTWTGLQWGNALINHLLYILWGLPMAIISDRDRKFTSKMWQDMYENLKVKTLFSTAWHPQTDGSSERTNQQVELAMRYIVASMSNHSSWPEVLPMISATLSNNVVAKDLIEMAEEVNDGNGRGEDNASENPDKATAYPVEPMNVAIYRPATIDTKDAIKLAAMYMKKNYDKKHTPMFFEVGQYVMLRLHRGYKVPGLENRNTKIEQQFAGPFKVLRKIGRLAYRLELPTSTKSIHPVINVAYLEPAKDPATDPFRGPFSQHIVHGLVPEILLNKRCLNRRGSGKMTQYLVRYIGRGTDSDAWILDKNLPPELVHRYEESLHSENIQ
ncbi:hypothetical protein K3495_g7440 [Podosphaera aphanis]|nr:hypothetical protein K3495_g7440 [Podosphaera aphanis]